MEDIKEKTADEIEDGIKLLEEWIEEQNKAFAKSDFLEDIPMPKEKIVMENLIREYRKLEKMYEEAYVEWSKETTDLKEYQAGYDMASTYWKSKVKQIRDKAECMDYYCLNDVIDDLNKLLGDE